MGELREATPTIKFIDDYCQGYRHLFPEVRSFEAFKYLHVGMISDLKKGKTTDYVKRLMFEVYKPQARLKEGDIYQKTISS